MLHKEMGICVTESHIEIILIPNQNQVREERET